MWFSFSFMWFSFSFMWFSFSFVWFSFSFMWFSFSFMRFWSVECHTQTNAVYISEEIEVRSDAFPCFWVFPCLERSRHVSIPQCFALAVSEDHFVSTIFVAENKVSVGKSDSLQVLLLDSLKICLVE